jgi:hypothetical protein
MDRLGRRQRKLEARIDGVDADTPLKPKGMHWSTSPVICERIDAVEQAKEALFCAQALRLSMLAGSSSGRDVEPHAAPTALSGQADEQAEHVTPDKAPASAGALVRSSRSSEPLPSTRGVAGERQTHPLIVDPSIHSPSTPM